MPSSRLTWIGPDGTFTPLPFAPRPFVSLRISPDGRRVATASLEAGRLLIRLFDLDRGTDDVARIAAMNWNPVWLPDGRLSFTSMRKGDFDVYVKDVDSSVPETAVLAGPDDTDPVAWTRDGRLVLQGSEPDGVYPLKLLDPRKPGAPQRLTQEYADGGSLSPDDQWLIYHTANSGRPRIHVRPLDGTAPAVALSSVAGEFPTFLRDGRQLAFMRDSQLIVRSWRDRDGRFEAGPEQHARDAGLRLRLAVQRPVRLDGRRPAAGPRTYRHGRAAPHPCRARVGSRAQCEDRCRGAVTAPASAGTPRPSGAKRDPPIVSASRPGAQAAAQAANCTT